MWQQEAGRVFYRGMDGWVTQVQPKRVPGSQNWSFCQFSSKSVSFVAPSSSSSSAQYTHPPISTTFPPFISHPVFVLSPSPTSPSSNSFTFISNSPSVGAYLVPAFAFFHFFIDKVILPGNSTMQPPSLPHSRRPYLPMGSPISQPTLLASLSPRAKTASTSRYVAYITNTTCDGDKPSCRGFGSLFFKAILEPQIHPSHPHSVNFPHSPS